jgi:hypothetical protein
MLAFVVPHAAFVASPRCATVLPSVLPSPLEAHASRAFQYHPQHDPRPQRAPRSFLIAGAAFVAFSYAPTFYCPHRLYTKDILRLRVYVMILLLITILKSAQLL